MKNLKIKVVTLFTVTAMLLTAIAGGGVVYATEGEKSLSADDFIKMGQTERDSLTSEQISEITNSFNTLSEKELAAIDAVVWDKLGNLWKRASRAQAMAQLEDAISRIDQEPLAISSPGMRSSTDFDTAN